MVYTFANWKHDELTSVLVMCNSLLLSEEVIICKSHKLYFQSDFACLLLTKITSLKVN